MKKVITRIVSIMMALVLCLTAIPFTGMTAFAASGNINSLPTTIKSYPISTGNNTPGYASKGASSKSGTVYAADLCTIKTIYGDGYISVTYPTSGGKTRTLYFKSNSFFNGTTYKTASITKYATAYRRSSGSATIGSVDSADKLVYVVGNAVNGRYQIVYKVTGSNYYKLGWVSTSAVKFDGSTNNNTTSGNRAKLLSTAKNQVGYQATNSQGYGKGDYCKYGSFTGTNGQPWCAAFVAWCANQAGISTAVVPKSASCTTMASKSNSYVKWSSSALNNMDPGDVVFFASGSINGTKRHVGIVSSISGNRVTVIEGNTSADKVEYKTYTVNSNGYINQNWSYGAMYFSGYIAV